MALMIGRHGVTNTSPKRGEFRRPASQQQLDGVESLFDRPTRVQA